MADKQITVAVPEDRVPEFYAWFAAFLAADRGAASGGPGSGPGFPGGRFGPGPFGGRGRGPHGDAQPWTADDHEAARLKLDKGAHGVAGILAWPGRYSRKLDRELPILTEGRADGGTDYYMDPGIARLFALPPAAGD